MHKFNLMPRALKILVVKAPVETNSNWGGFRHDSWRKSETRKMWRKTWTVKRTDFSHFKNSEFESSMLEIQRQRRVPKWHYGGWFRIIRSIHWTLNVYGHFLAENMEQTWKILREDVDLGEPTLFFGHIPGRRAQRAVKEQPTHTSMCNNMYANTNSVRKSWRSDVPPHPAWRGASHGWVPVVTHSTPVPTPVGRLWVARNTT